MIGFAGLSHLGIVSSIAAAAKGFEVTAYDPNAELCERLSRGELPIFEPDLAESLAENQSRIIFTSELAKLGSCEVLYVALDIATDDDGTSDLIGLERLIDSVAPVMGANATLVVLSQVPPGFTRKLARKLGSVATGGDFKLFYQVETLIFGRAVERALYPERLIVGCADPQADLPPLYARLLSSFGCPILPMRYESAELTKISINMCLVSSVSVANTMAELCEKIGADWFEVIPALKLDKRIGQYAYLSPGLGISGGNLERDLATVVALANDLGTDDRVVDAWISNSRYRRDWAFRLIHQEVIARVESPVIAVWGLTYKPDTIATKNSPALALLAALAPFCVKAYDPRVSLDGTFGDNFITASSALEASSGADALAIMTPWRQFSETDLTKLRGLMRGRVIVDPYGALDEHRCLELGFNYFGLGRSVCK